MRNLRYFFHYHKGCPWEKAVKIVGSFFIVMPLFSLGFSLPFTQAADNYLQIAAELLPEPAPMPAPVVEVKPEPAPVAQPVPTTPTTAPTPAVESAPSSTVAPVPTTKVDESMKCPPGESPGINDRGEKSCIRPGPTPGTEEKYQEEMSEDMREQMDKERLTREKKDVLKQITQQKREVTSLIKKLKRLKGTADDATAAQEVYNKVLEFENKIKSSEELEDLQANLQEFYESELWEEINKIRRKVELPNELNNILKELTKLQKMLTQKSFTKLGFDVEAVKNLISEKLTKHSEAKTAYTQGDFETAEEIMQEDFRPNHPGNLNGALNMLREIKDQIRFIKDKELKAEIENLLTDVIASINSGDWEDARRSMEAIRQDLGPLLWKKLMQSEQKKQGVPDEFRNKLEQLKERLGGGEETKNEMP